MADESINIGSVVRRFDDSTKALSELQETIQTLGAAQETQERITDSIEGAASELSAFVAQVSETAASARESNSLLVQALGEAEKFLERTDLSQMQSQIQGLEEQLGSVVETLANSLQEARQATSAAEKAREDAESEARTLQTKFDGLPERTRNKLNL
jgi:conjugal transfer/entry exclusion protein